MAEQVAERRALLTDGRQLTIRPVRADDEVRLVRLHDGLSERSMYLRFFSVNRLAAAEFVRRAVSSEGVFGHSVLAELGGEVVGMATYQALSSPRAAEVALAIADEFQSRGVGTLLFEYLVSHARRNGVESFHAEMLAENGTIYRLFTDSGLPAQTRREDDTLIVEISLRYDEKYLDVVSERERRADVTSMGPLLAPSSVAVIGASTREHTVGNAILRHLLVGEFRGMVYAVNSHADTVAGLTAYPDVASLPEVPDLAVLAVPADAVPGVAEQCGRRGVRALVVISSGMTGSGPDSSGGQLRKIVARHGMRLVGPNCLGIINTDPSVALDATFARANAPRGNVGIVTQSGGIGIALLESMSRIGIGVSTFVSTGDKYDVSSNDLLMWWSGDPRTDIAVVYVESFGNPRKFARLARHLAAHKPVVAVRAAGSPVAQRAARSHTAATATPGVTRDALFRQAGVIPTDGLQETLDVVALLSHQPLPAGRGVAIVSNVGGGGVLAADAASRYGVELPSLSATTIDELAAVLPANASTANPVDTTAGIDAATFAEAIRITASDPAVDTLVAIVAPTALGTLQEFFADATLDLPVPYVVVDMGQEVGLSARTAAAGVRPVPTYLDPSAAIRAVAHVAAYSSWLARDPGSMVPVSGTDRDTAQQTVDGFLAAHPDGGWLDWVDLDSIARSYRLPVAAGTVVTDAAAAVAAFADAHGPVAAKAMVAGLVHRTDQRAVVVGLDTAEDVQATYERMALRFGSELNGVLIQPMVPSGLELLVGVTQDEAFGPLLQVGAGGVATDLEKDRAARLLPLTDRDAAEMVESLRVAPMFRGFRGAAPLDVTAVEDTMRRVARLADDLPSIAEVDINPLIVHPQGCTAVDVKIRVAPASGADPYLRRLR